MSAMTTNKRALPASLTFNGASPLKRENFVTECLGKMKLDNAACGDAQNEDTVADEALIDDDGSTGPTTNLMNPPPPLSFSAALDPDVAGMAYARKASNKDFKRLIVLGTGSFAKVILVKSLLPADNDSLFAMKVLDKKLIIAKKQTSHTMTERSVLGRCSSSHPFIVSLKYAFQTPDTLNLVIDFCAGGELYYHLSRVGRFPEERARFYAAELMLALEHLHSFNVVYRDLKPENVLIAGDGHIMLADFGLSKEGIHDFTHGADTFCGTPEYLAPEILWRRGHGTAVDWWSLGILLYEMLHGLPPWYSKNRRTMFEGICNKELAFPPRSQASSHAKEIIAGLLVKNPRFRLGSGGVEEVKTHPFFSGIDLAALLRKSGPVPWRPDKGKIYFDVEYTRLPCDTPHTPGQPTAAATSSAPAPPPPLVELRVEKNSGGDQLLAAENLLAGSPLLASSFVEKAFSGFSFTDPLAVPCSPGSLSETPRRTMGPHATRLLQQVAAPDDSARLHHLPPTHGGGGGGLANTAQPSASTNVTPAASAHANAAPGQHPSLQQSAANASGHTSIIHASSDADPAARPIAPSLDGIQCTEDDDELGQFDLELDAEG